MRGLLLKLQNFKKVKLIFGHPVQLERNKGEKSASKSKMREKQILGP